MGYYDEDPYSYETPEKDVPIAVSITLSKNSSIETKEYDCFKDESVEFDSEGTHHFIETSYNYYCNFTEEYRKQRYTIPELLKELERLLLEEKSKLDPKKDSSRLFDINKYLEECSGWVVDDCCCVCDE